jgi:hypothetical protein
MDNLQLLSHSWSLGLLYDTRILTPHRSLKVALLCRNEETALTLSTSDIINVNVTLPLLESIYDLLDFQKSLEEYWTLRRDGTLTLFRAHYIRYPTNNSQDGQKAV